MITQRFDILADSLHGVLKDARHGEQTFTGVSIDSRTITPGRLFVALKGEVHDGHDFIPGALERRAAGVMGQKDHPALKKLHADVPVVEVADPHQALIQLATNYRSEIATKRVAISGSNGKTTTKEMAYRLLVSVEPKTYRSPGNYNNLFGLPLSILDMPSEAPVGVFELGISTPGEMAKLAVILGPQLVLITNVGPSHLEFLGSVEQVAKEKLSLLQGSPDARLIVNADNAILMAEAAKTGREMVTFGIDNEADWRPDSIESDREGNTRVVIEGNPFRVPLFGRHQVSNLLAAYAITRELGYSFKDVNTGSITLSTAPLRGERLELHGVTIIADCYNANPDSVTAGLRSLTRLQRSGRLFVVLGDMLELGEHSRDYHRQIGTLLATLDYDRVLLVGPLSTAILDGALEGGASPSRLTHYETADACADILTDELGAGDLLYVKGSRGIGLEKLIDHWRKYGGEG